jgi:hypothetical protein
VRPDDRTLTGAEARRVEQAARNLLDRADAWGAIPAPIEDLLGAAKLKVVPTSIFDPRSIAAYAKAAGAKVANTVKRALGKIWGVLDTAEEVIHIDDSVTPGKQLFLKLHETGHFELPHQKKLFRFFEDSKQELDPSIADLFEREANNFASFIMFNGSLFAEQAADLAVSFASAKKMQSRFKVSLYAAVREYTRTHHAPCLALCLELPVFSPSGGTSAEVRRIEASGAFDAAFERPQAPIIGKGHVLARLLPVGRKVTRPTTFNLCDRNGDVHEFVGEALDTTFNVLIFACPTSVFKK